jgi:hybrid cluster-associated redox disulfide protein
MNNVISINAEANVDELITRYPTVARVFIRRRMACVVGEIARFESIADVCGIYHQPLETFLGELQAATEKSVPA